MDRQNLCTSIKTHIYNVYCGYIFHLVKQIHTQTHSINRPNRPELICKRGWLADSGVLFGLLEVPLEEAAGSGVLSTRLISHAFTSMLLLILQLAVSHTHTQKHTHILFFSAYISHLVSLFLYFTLHCISLFSFLILVFLSLSSCLYLSLSLSLFNSPALSLKTNPI